MGRPHDRTTRPPARGAHNPGRGGHGPGRGTPSPPPPPPPRPDDETRSRSPESPSLVDSWPGSRHPVTALRAVRERRGPFIGGIGGIPDDCGRRAPQRE